MGLRGREEGKEMGERKVKITVGDGNPADVGNLTSGSSAFPKYSLNIRKFTVHILLNPGLENFEHYLASM